MNLRAEIQRLLGLEESVKTNAALVFNGRYLQEHLARLAKRLLVAMLLVSLVGCSAKGLKPEMGPPPPTLKPGSYEWQNWMREKARIERDNEQKRDEADTTTWMTAFTLLSVVAIGILLSHPGGGGGDVIHVVCTGCD